MCDKKVTDIKTRKKKAPYKSLRKIAEEELAHYRLVGENEPDALASGEDMSNILNGQEEEEDSRHESDEDKPSGK